jgi:hypothetical protein
MGMRWVRWFGLNQARAVDGPNGGRRRRRVRSCTWVVSQGAGATLAETPSQAIGREESHDAPLSSPSSPVPYQCGEHCGCVAIRPNVRRGNTRGSETKQPSPDRRVVSVRSRTDSSDRKTRRSARFSEAGRPPVGGAFRNGACVSQFGGGIVHSVSPERRCPRHAD